MNNKNVKEKICKCDRIKVLHYIPGYNYGGIESFVTTLAEELNDCCKFYYLVEKDIEASTIGNLKHDGSEVIRIPNMTKEGFFKHILAVRKIFKDTAFDVVHVHDCDNRFFVMFMSRFFGVKKRFYHVHSKRSNSNRKIKDIIKKVGIILNVHFATCCLACSDEAAESKKIKKYIVVSNGIKVKDFCYSDNARKNIREKYNIPNDSIVLLFVGRIEKVKNVEYLVDILRGIPSELVDKYILMILGDGGELNYIKGMVKKYRLSNVIFVGRSEKSSEYYSASDFLCLPSIAEGFSIVLLEAQASGLSCFVSKNVPNFVGVNGRVKYIGVRKEDLKEWINLITKEKKPVLSVRKDAVKCLVEKGFDSKTMAKNIVNIYKSGGLE